MKLKTRQRFLSLILTLCLLLSMTVQSVWAAEEGGGTVTPPTPSGTATGTLEFTDIASIGENNNTVIYANGADNYQLQISYPDIGTNVIKQNEGHTELQNIPSNINIKFTLTTPASHTGALPNLMIGGARESFDGNKQFIKSFDFSTNNHFMIRLDFPNNGGSDPEGTGGNNNNNGVSAGDIRFNVGGEQNGGTLYYSFDQSNWTPIANNDTLSKDTLSGKDRIYVKYEVNEGFRLDDYIDNGLSVNRVYVDGTPSALSFTQQNTAEILYSADKQYTIEIRFMSNGSNPPQTGEGNLPTDVKVTFWSYEQLRTDAQGNPVYGYVRVTNPFAEVPFEGMRMNGFESFSETNGTITYTASGHALDSSNKNRYSMHTQFGAKAEAVYLVKITENGNISKIDGSDFSYYNEDWSIDLVPAESYDIAFEKGISDDLTIIWTTNRDIADKWPDGEIGGDFGNDMFLEHGTADIVSIKRGDQIIYDETHQNNSVNISDDFGFVAAKRGDDIVLKVIPDYGYQLASANINGNDLVPEDKEVSTFYINNIQNNLHFSGIFEEANNTSTDNLAFSVPDTISDVVSSGTLNMEAAETALNENIVPENYTGINTYDITLENRVSKGEADSYWVNPVTDLGNATATVSLKAERLDPNAEYKVLRQHENEDPVLLDATFDPNDQTLNFETNKFSAYTIITPTPACTTHRWNPTITFAADGKTASYTAVCDVCTAPASGNAVVTSAVKTAATYTEKGTTTYTATVLLDGQTFTATKDVPDIPVLTRPEESTTPPEPTTPVEPTTPAEPTTPVEPPKPTAPVYAATTITKIENTTSGVKLTWKKVPKASGYYIYRGSSKIKTLTSASKVSYTDTKAKKNGGKYTYRVYAYYKVSGGKIKTSAASPAKSTIYLSRPSTPSAKNYYKRKAVAKWNRNKKASGYKVECCLRSDFSGSKISATLHRNSSVTKKFTGLKKGKTYYFRVRSYKTVNGINYYSPWSKTCSRKIKK